MSDNVRPDRHRPDLVEATRTALSLYSGAGGLDQGFAVEHFKPIWANEIDPHAAATYEANLGEHIVCGDVLAAPVPEVDVDVVIGGPPCQAFSRIGRMDPTDARAEHVDRFLDVVEQLRPKAFVMENVAHLGEAPRWSETRRLLLDRAREELDYDTEIYVLNSSHFGVPQARRRMFMIGLRDGQPSAPTPTTADSPPTVRQALAKLPGYGEPGNDTGGTARVVPAKAPVMRPTAHKGSLLFNGSGRPLDLDAPAKTLPASMGGNATPIIDQLHLTDGTEPWVIEYHRRLQSGGKPRKRAPKRMRRLTVQECAALQTFPDNWQWKGPVGARYRQIGNAVPPKLAAAVARAVRESLDAVERRELLEPQPVAV